MPDGKQMEGEPEINEMVKEKITLGSRSRRGGGLARRIRFAGEEMRSAGPPVLKKDRVRSKAEGQRPGT